MNRDKWIKLRVSDAERTMVEEIKKLYGLDSDSETIRRCVEYVHRKRPVLGGKTIKPKEE